MRSLAESFLERSYRAYLQELPNHLRTMLACMQKKQMIKFSRSLLRKKISK